MQKDLSCKRMQDFRKLIKQASLDAYVVISPLEQRYLSGIELSEGEAIFLITPKKAYCITKKLIASKMVSTASFIKTEDVPFGSMLNGTLTKIKELKLKRVAFDPSTTNFETGNIFVKENFVKADGLITQMRMQKDADEVAKLRKACKIAHDSFEEVKPLIKTGLTEDEVRILMAIAMHKRGADSIPFNIVCFGENTADAHHTPSKTRKLKANEPILMDFGCFYEGYTSDMTRSWWHGTKEPLEYKKIWNIVHKAYTAGVKTLCSGTTAGEIDKATRDVIEKEGYGKEFFHTTGHGIGLEEHDAPILRSGSPEKVLENYVVTIEPGIYFENKWGIRLEDSFLVTKTGSKKFTKN